MFTESPPVSLSRVISAAFWVVCWGFIIAGWVAFLCDYADLGMMLFLSCLPFAWTAALLTIKEWARGLCRVITNTAALRGEAARVAHLR